jgi:hypothetical protein
MPIPTEISTVCIEEVVMQKRLADEANRIGHQAQEQLQSGFEAAARSFAETHKGFQSLALEMIEYSKAAFDDATRTWEQLIGVKSVDQAMQIQSAYAKRVYENHMAELTKLGQMCGSMVTDAVRDASRGNTFLR